MLPSLLAREIIQGLQAYITTGFETPTPHFSGAFRELVETPGRFYKGPYLSADLPFQAGDAGTDFFSGLKTDYPPYRHQQQAWQRLASDRDARSTLIATGTGSGKTECFLYPLLDHCARHPGPGVKAVIIYPMNALATDQARRFAATIHGSDKLRGKVRVGLFVGGLEEAPVKTMGPEQVITDKQVMRDNPPDILLTNYKMLDFLLLRPGDQAIWRHNGPDTLRYLVVDELHTFDGAQGTDLACLIRRLKARLLPDGGDRLICTGTSATLGGRDQMTALIGYARQIFQRPFDSDSIIGETRQQAGEFLDLPIEHVFIPPEALAEILDPRRYATAQAYVQAQYRLLFPDQGEARPSDKDWCIELGDALKRHLLFNNLLRLLAQQPRSMEGLAGEFVNTLPRGEARSQALPLLDALCALVSIARKPDGMPLVNLRLQLWTRELRRIVAPVRSGRDGGQPRLTFADDLKQDDAGVYLPLVQCNHCHATGWLSRKKTGSQKVETDLRLIYNDFFRQEPESQVLLPLQPDEPAPGTAGRVSWLCGECGQLQSGEGDCLACGESGLQRVFLPNLIRESSRQGNPRLVSERDCPVCAQKDALLIFGARSTSLSSVAIHHNYASPFNDDKKLIAFSDNVQDAAHRAGFFSARTWQNNVRMGITRALPEGGMRLVDFWNHLPRFWQDPEMNPEAMSPERYLVEFIAPNMTWFQDYVELEEKGRLPQGSNLLERVNSRLVWEVLAEFGYRSQIGRSLERTGIAVLGFDRDAVAGAARALLTPLREQEGLTDVSEGGLRWFLLGLLLRMKQRGAIYHGMIEEYVASGCKGYLLHRVPWMPDFYRQSHTPSFLLEGKARAGFDGLVADRKGSWYQNWLHKCLGAEQLMLPEQAEMAIYGHVRKSLQTAGILKLLEFKGHRVWALDPESLYIATDVAQLETDQARDRLQAPRELADWLEGMPSLVMNDPGRYRPVVGRESWLASIYREGDIRRVIAREHTGLLDRETRQRLEQDFIDGSQPWQPNLLSATPTLEMGIDIGELSSILLCTVPPTQASYLQRIGRSGRRDGNAFNMTLAAGVPHDLYFYEDPLQMMKGQVEPPGVFLNASAVISRQLTAYCMDRWVQSGIGMDAIPKTLKPVLDSVETGELGRFPYNFLSFVNGNATPLLDGFFDLFADELSDATRQYLKAFILGEGETDGLEMRLVKRLTEMLEERKSFRRQVDQLKRHIDKLKEQPQDEAVKNELEEATLEREAIQAMLRRLNARQALNFLTDEGVIPNYAFPEEGVTLRSVIYRRQSQAGADGKAYENIVYEYERSGAAAISELAPNSRFYAGGRKVRISRIDLKLSQFEPWRFCPSCAFSQRELSQNVLNQCPRCGDPMWSDSGQLAMMLRLKQVMANTSDRDSRIGDDSDDRDSRFFNKQMLVDIDTDMIGLAYGIDDPEHPFGFEFVRGATFREINFGEYGLGRESSIGGNLSARKGFSLCKHCGMVQENNNKDQRHGFTCPARKEDPADEKHFIDCLYLYREFSSEAVRILLPGHSAEGFDQPLNSFVAALQLGLKLQFGGEVDHLRVTTYSEPIPESDSRRRYLMLYDSVPGGTGYLQDLLQTPEALLEVFRKAYNRMVTCGCNQDPEKDGCYQCLYAYRNSYGMQSTSRDTAIEMFGAILDHADALKRIKTVSAIHINPALDSELEHLFISALKKSRGDTHEVRIRQQVVSGKPGYFLSVNDRFYTMEPQALLGEGQGVQVPSKPDFLIRSVSSGDAQAFKPVAVFLDGYRYHKDSVADDSLKRYALIQSGGYYVWSLTWDDVQSHYEGSGNGGANPFAEDLNPDMQAVQEKLLQRLEIKDLFKVALHQAMSQLLDYLSNPDGQAWSGLAFVRMLGWFDQGVMRDADHIDRIKQNFESHAPGRIYEQVDRAGDSAFGTMGQVARMNVDCVIPLEVFTNLDIDKVACNIWLEDQDSEGAGFKENWQTWLKAYNLLQFLPTTGFATAKGVEQGLYEEITLQSEIIAEAKSADTGKWTTILDEVVDDIRPALRRWLQDGGKAPEVGFEYVGGDGAITAEAELAWPDDKIAGLLDEQIEYQKSFSDAGWRVVELDDQGVWIDQHPLKNN